MATNRIPKIFSSDSTSLWNVSISPGWTKAELEVLRCAIIKYGIGSWKVMIDQHVLPGKTVSQIVCMVQRMIGQQSLKEFLKIHVDVYAVGKENAKRTDVCRKNGIIINNGHNLTPLEVRKKREANLKKYGLPKDVIEHTKIPVLTEKQTSEVFDKRTNLQLEREKLLSRLAVLRSALDYLQNGSIDSSLASKRRRLSSKKKKRFLSDSDMDSDSSEIPLDLSLPKRQSRRQRGLQPDFEYDDEDM